MPEPLFNVVVDRPRSTEPGAAATLAAAISARYGIPAADLERRLTRGKFRVKSRVDRATADAYVADLTRLGAICVRQAIDEPSATSITPPSGEVEAVTLPQVAREQAPRPPSDRGPRVSFGEAIPPSERGPRVPLEAPAEPQTSGNPLDLGVLSAGFNLTLSTLDGANPDTLTGGSAAQVAQNAALPASFGPAPTPPAPAPVPSPAGSSSRLPRVGSSPAAKPAVRGPAMPVADLAGIDRRFEPPRGEGEDAEVALDTALPSRRERGAVAARNTGASQSAAPHPAPAHGAPTHAPVPLPPRVVDVTARPGMMVASSSQSAAAPGHGLRDPRRRMVVGAVLAVGLGFVPAHIVGTMREQSAYAELDRDLTRKESSIRTREDWQAFDAIRDSYADRKRSARTNIILVSLLVWAAVGGGVAWLWFRKVDWDRVLGPAAPR